ncbi:MAG: type 1 glutamine amidotransferase [Thermoleophilaceae bacterium]
MRLLVAVHQADAGPGVFAEVARAAGVEVVEWQPQSGPAPDGADAVLVLGGAMHPVEDGDHPWLADEREWLRGVIARGVPLLGVCLGAELVGQAAGGEAVRLGRSEIGWHKTSLTPEAAGDPLFSALPPGFPALQWHSYALSPPPSATVLASSPTCAQGYRVAERAWGIQFHAEVTPEIVEGWIAEAEETDAEDVREAGVSLADLRARTAVEIDAWTELGRSFFERFLQVTRDS